MIPSLFSVSYAGAWGQHSLSTVDFIRKAAHLGYPAIQLAGKAPHLDFVRSNDREIEEITAVALECGVEIHSIAAYNDFTATASPGTPLPEMQLAYIRRLAEIARKLGARYIRIFSGYISNDNEHYPEWRRCVAATRESAQLAADYGIAIGVQNHHDVGVNRDAYTAFLDEVDHPNCRACFDPWTPALFGDDLYAAARELAPRMLQTTLADYVRQRRFRYLPGLVNYEELPAMLQAVPLGAGFIDLADFFRGLKDGGFAGYVVYEMCSPLRGGGGEENLDRTAAASREKIMELARP